MADVLEQRPKGNEKNTDRESYQQQTRQRDDHQHGGDRNPHTEHQQNPDDQRRLYREVEEYLGEPSEQQRFSRKVDLRQNAPRPGDNIQRHVERVLEKRERHRSENHVDRIGHVDVAGPQEIRRIEENEQDAGHQGGSDRPEIAQR